MSMKPDVMKALVDEYEAFLRVGRVTSEEWEVLDTEERACMLLAQKRIDVERAIMTVQQDPIAVALLMSQLDGGEQLGELKVRAVIDAIMAKQERQLA